jgi:hypothetical protein
MYASFECPSRKLPPLTRVHRKLRGQFIARDKVVGSAEDPQRWLRHLQVAILNREPTSLIVN